MPFAYRGVALCFLSIEPADFRSSGLVAQPGACVSLHLSELADHSEHVRMSRHNGGAVFSKHTIREFQGVFDKPHFFVDCGNPRRGSPGTLFMAPIIFLDECWT